jgi:hypothetical protein
MASGIRGKIRNQEIMQGQPSACFMRPLDVGLESVMSSAAKIFPR